MKNSILVFSSMFIALHLSAADVKSELSKCERMKTESAKKKCVEKVVRPFFHPWRFSPVEKSPINDAITATANFREGDGEIMLGCSEGSFFMNFSLGVHLNTMNNHYYPIIYRIDSEPAVDCSTNGGDNLSECMRWQVSRGGYAVGVWNGEDVAALVEKIGAAKKLTIRAGNVLEERTVIFNLKNLLRVYDAMKMVCRIDDPPAEIPAGKDGGP